MPRKRKSDQIVGEEEKKPVEPEEPVEEEYEVESILTDRCSAEGDDKQYLIKWLGYGEHECTWESATNLTHCEDLLRAYDHQKQQQEAGGDSGDCDHSSSSAAAAATDHTDHTDQLSSSAVVVMDDPTSPPSIIVSEGPPVSSIASAIAAGDAADLLPDLTADGAPAAPLNGWDRGWVAKKVLGVTKYADQSLWVLVAWQEANQPPDLVPNYVANLKIPDLMIQYYQQHMRWNEYSGRKGGASHQ